MLRLRGLMSAYHLLICQYVLHNEVFIFLPNRLVQFLLVIWDELLNINVVSLRLRNPLSSIDLLGVGSLSMLLLLYVAIVKLCSIDLVTAVRLPINTLVHYVQVTWACHLLFFTCLKLERLGQNLNARIHFVLISKLGLRRTLFRRVCFRGSVIPDRVICIWIIVHVAFPAWIGWQTSLTERLSIACNHTTTGLRIEVTFLLIVHLRLDALLMMCVLGHYLRRIFKSTFSWPKAHAQFDWWLLCANLVLVFNADDFWLYARIMGWVDLSERGRWGVLVFTAATQINMSVCSFAIVLLIRFARLFELTLCLLLWWGPFVDFSTNLAMLKNDICV